MVSSAGPGWRTSHQLIYAHDHRIPVMQKKTGEPRAYRGDSNQAISAYPVSYEGRTNAVMVELMPNFLLVAP